VTISLCKQGRKEMLSAHLRGGLRAWLIELGRPRRHGPSCSTGAPTPEVTTTWLRLGSDTRVLRYLGRRSSRSSVQAWPQLSVRPLRVGKRRECGSPPRSRNTELHSKHLDLDADEYVLPVPVRDPWRTPVDRGGPIPQSGAAQQAPLPRARPSTVADVHNPA
jgi:hypothetical protein